MNSNILLLKICLNEKGSWMYEVKDDDDDENESSHRWEQVEAATEAATPTT